MITKVETNTGVVVLERMFPWCAERYEREDSLVRVITMQRVESLGGSYEDAAEWVIDQLEAGTYRFA